MVTTAASLPGAPSPALVRYFLRLGAAGFGGPIALVARMHRELVEERGWLTGADYREGLALAQLAPGPLAVQLAMYIGYLQGGVRGAAAAGVAFVLPSFTIVSVLGWLYVRYDGLPWMAAVFYGVGAAVIGLIAKSAYRLAAKTVGRDPVLWGCYGVLAITTALTGRELAWLFLAAGLVTWLGRAPPRWLQRRPVACDAATPLLLLHLLGFFAYSGAFVFGSGLAIVPFLRGGVVEDYRWLTERQFLDAVAVAMITPGPVVIGTAFIGYLVGGIGGALVAAIGIFVPCYFLTVLPAPYFRRYGRYPSIAALVEGVTAAAAGAIAGAVIVLGRSAVVDPMTAVLAVATLGLVVWKPKIPEVAVAAAAAAVGLAVRL